MYKKFIITLVILASLSLFKLVFIPSSIYKMLEFILPVIILFLVILYKLYDNSFRFKSRFNIEIGLIFLAVILSMFGAYYFHKQDFAITAVTQRYIYFFLFYPLLHVLKPKLEEIGKIILYISLIYAVLFIIQTVIFPAKLSDVTVFRDRGTIRIFMPGATYFFVAYLISFSLLIRTYHLRYLLFCILAISIFVLLGTRQLIGPVAIVTLLNLFLSKKVKSRALNVLLILFMIIPFYFLFKDIFGAMIELSQKQVTHYSEDVRYKAAVFYLFEFFPNKLSYIIGNGVPSSNSPYGLQINAFKDLFGFYQSDIGIIGDFTKFGIFMVIAQISIYVRIIFMRLPTDYEFIKYFIISNALTMLLGTAFGDAGNIVILCIVLYLVDVSALYEPSGSKGFAEIIENEKQKPSP